MSTDYYIVGNLRKDYEVTYSRVIDGRIMLDGSMMSLIRCRRTDFYWWVSIHRLMKASKVLAKVMFVIRRMEGISIHISRSSKS